MQQLRNHARFVFFGSRIAYAFAYNGHDLFSRVLRFSLHALRFRLLCTHSIRCTDRIRCSWHAGDAGS